MDQESAKVVEEAGRWPKYIIYQFYRIGRAALPLPLMRDQVHRPTTAFAGLFILVFALWRAVKHRHREPALTLVLAGVVWHVAMKNLTVFHEYETIFHVGLIALFYAALLDLLQEKARAQGIARAACVVAPVVFAVAYVGMSQIRREEAALTDAIRTAEYQAVRDTLGEKRAWIGLWRGGGHLTRPEYAVGVSHYLAQHFVADTLYPAYAEYVITGHDALVDTLDVELLTPEHRHVFLYRNPAYRGE